MTFVDLSHLPPPPRESAALPPPPRQRLGRVEPDAKPGQLLLVCLAAGVALDIGLRGGVANAVVTGGVVLVLVALSTGDRLVQPQARWLAMLAMVPTLLLSVRVSPWLVASNLAAIAGLAGASIVFSRSGSVFDTTPLRLLERCEPALSRAVRAPHLLAPIVPSVSTETRRTVTRVGTAVAMAVPMLGVIVALLAAADPVFAGMILPNVDPSVLIGHAVLVVLFAVVALAVVAAAGGDGSDSRASGYFGVLEVVTMLTLAAFVLSLFVISQLVALTDAGRRLVETAGLTPADYARSGFFQLCWAAAFLLLFLAVVRRFAEDGVMHVRIVQVLAAAVPLLALGLVVVSLRRMAYYDDAFGLTMLRLWVMGAAVWMGVVLVMIAARNGGVGTNRSWVTGAAGLVAVALVVAANLANAEALVARHNIARAATGSGLDYTYLAGLSDDALPAIADAIGSGAGGLDDARLVGALRCWNRSHGVESLNLAQRRADDLRARFC